MPKCCSVYKCKATSKNAPNRNFHLYPKDAKLPAAWVKRIRRENFKPSDYSYACSHHFIDEDFKVKQPHKDEPPEFRKAILKPDSIPAGTCVERKWMKGYLIGIRAHQSKLEHAPQMFSGTT